MDRHLDGAAADGDAVSSQDRPDVTAVLTGLKDFQRRTVDHAFARMYTDATPTHRMLVADEVGLGKTLIARGLVARAIDHLWEEVERIDVVYICSNADIARQNIERLCLPGQRDVALASRLTLLPRRLHDLGANRVNFVSLTPGTSFERGSNLGTVEERALLAVLLERAWGRRPAGGAHLLRGRAAPSTLLRKIGEVRAQPLDEALADEFADRLTPRDREEFTDLCARFRVVGRNPRDEDRAWQAAFVSALRARLAQVCVDALEPDVIILDEFQRFAHMLTGEDDASRLAQQLFTYSDEHSQARTLLLSATPYRMYTLAGEDGDDHHRDFTQTMGFLLGDAARRRRLEELLDRYRRGLYRIGDGVDPGLRDVRREVEEILRTVAVRTERLAASADRNGMLTEVPAAHAPVRSRDVEGFVALARTAGDLGQHGAVEFWKSSPYCLSFMDDYLLKRHFRSAVEQGEVSARRLRELERAGAFLSWREVERYGRIDPGNARLRSLVADTVERGLWRLLWIPPSLPYWHPSGVFAAAGVRDVTKRLVFSSWQVVPKMISGMLSYEAERQIMRGADADAENTPESRQRRSPLLRFALDRSGEHERPTGMPVVALIHPSHVLAALVDPARVDAVRIPSAREIVASVARDVRDMLRGLEGSAGRSGAPDPAWYWAAPLLLDAAADDGATGLWLDEPSTAHAISRTESGARDDGDRWPEHLQAAAAAARGEHELGPMPHDLAEVVARLALAAPGTVALRALGHHAAGIELQEPWLRNAAGHIAWGFRSLFNTPEAMALIRGSRRSAAYWQAVLGYCLAGNLPAVLDEYLHVLREAHGLTDRPARERVEKLAAAVHDAVTLRTAPLEVDVVTQADAPEPGLSRRRMRGRFARRLGDTASDDERMHTAAHLREAFNSPFWPFVLASTSVGQEGLDFHPYCHAVVHWNLPGNPVDLEQREGRVHRFKNHAVRKNLARRYGRAGTAGESDPWDALFRRGVEDRPVDANDLVPFWVYPAKGDASMADMVLAKIERHVPMLPLSRETEHLPQLRRSLAVYRMVFGQPRQEDLLAHLIAQVGPEHAAQLLDDLRIDLSP